MSGELDPPKSLRTKYQVENETQNRNNQKVVKNKNDELVVKNYPEKKQPIIRKPKHKPSNCPSCKRIIWLEFDKGYFCRKSEFYVINLNYQFDEKSSGARLLFFN